MKQEREVAIIHYNTPELTEAAILSLRKHGGEDYHVTVFDNSAPAIDQKTGERYEARPFTAEMPGVTVIDNTKGQVIDFEKELAKYPDKSTDIGCVKSCVFGSDKHMMTVQYIMDHVLTDGFLLMDSDILIRQSVDFMFQEDQCCVGHIIGSSGPNNYQRLAPMLLWINSKMCKDGGAVFFDPDRSWALNPGGYSNKKNGWDTGAALLQDIQTKKPQCHGKRIDIRPLMFHFGSGSWYKNDTGRQQQWLQEHRDLWYTEPEPREAKYTVMTYIFGGYEFPHEVMEKDPDAEYLLITDDKNLKSATWQVIYDPSLAGRNPIESNYDVRLHPFRYAHTDVVVRIDGSIELKKSLAPLLKAFNDGGYDRCLMIHPARNNFAQELECWVTQRHYPQEVADRTLTMMKAWGYDLDYQGMFQGCFEIVRNTEKNRDINRLTYQLMKYTGGEEVIDSLDQHIFSFVVNTLHQDLKVLPVSENLITMGSKLAQWYIHKSMRPISNPNKIAPMMFNKPCECWDMPATEVTGTKKEGKATGKPKTAKRTNSKKE
jgi:hypothetical protein